MQKAPNDHRAETLAYCAEYLIHQGKAETARALLEVAMSRPKYQRELRFERALLEFSTGNTEKARQLVEQADMIPREMVTRFTSDAGELQNIWEELIRYALAISEFDLASLNARFDELARTCERRLWLSIPILGEAARKVRHKDHSEIERLERRLIGM
jgi:hypothetical protein